MELRIEAIASSSVSAISENLKILAEDVGGRQAREAS